MTKQIDISKVAQIVQARFPLQWEICLQQAYIEMLKEEVEDKKDDGADA